MIAAADFNITRVEKSKLSEMSLDNVPFGKYFSDHMLEVDYENGEWKTVAIKPYQPISFEPSLAALHYGQAIFEGIKAFKNQEGIPQLFRPYENFQRFNLSAERMEMPKVPEGIFIEGMKQLIKLDVDWIPDKPFHSLYIRPFMFSTDEMIGVKPSSKYKFMIILSPTGPYYSVPMRIYVEEKYVRAVEGGVGFAKNAGNYGAAMHPSAEAKRKGYDQVLWMDAMEHKYVQECGTMNIFFLIGNKAITPGLESGTILAGVTRDSVIQLLGDLDFIVEERNLSIDEVMDAYKAGTLKEVFGSGTAATISMIRELRYKDFVMEFDVDKWSIGPKIRDLMSGIKEGRIDDKYNWMVKI
ncbi:MAG: branched-chain amino acid aminotransferase [Ginsengibacter sp.]